MTPLPLILAVSAALSSLPSSRPGPTDRSVTREGRVETIAHEQLEHEPGSFVGRELRLVLQFHSLEESWNPFLTRFSPADYVAVRGWTDAQLPWLQGDFERRPVRVFSRRSELALDHFFRIARPHERIAVVGVVREVFAGQPWFEVTSAEILPRSIPEGSVLHVIRALDFEQKHAFRLALGELERASAAPLPKHALDAVGKIQRRCEAASRR